MGFTDEELNTFDQETLMATYDELNQGYEQEYEETCDGEGEYKTEWGCGYCNT